MWYYSCIEVNLLFRKLYIFLLSHALVLCFEFTKFEVTNLIHDFVVNSIGG